MSYQIIYIYFVCRTNWYQYIMYVVPGDINILCMSYQLISTYSVYQAISIYSVCRTNWYQYTYFVIPGDINILCMSYQLISIYSVMTPNIVFKMTHSMILRNFCYTNTKDEFLLSRYQRKEIRIQRGVFVTKTSNGVFVIKIPKWGNSHPRLFGPTTDIMDENTDEGDT